MTMTSYCRAAMATPMTGCCSVRGLRWLHGSGDHTEGTEAGPRRGREPRPTARFRGSAASSPVNRWASWRQSGRGDLEDIVLYTGLLQRPYALVQNPGVRVVSGFFGPVERMARAAGPSSRRRATRSGSRSPRWMPRIEGILELGGNRVHVSEVDAWVEHDAELLTLPEEQPSPEDLAIASRVCERILPESILQFGIGAIPDEIARILAKQPGGSFGIHTEMISDGVMRLHEA